MVNENLIPKTETVYEIKNEIPSYEEFMKTYKVDENFNYDDLSGGSMDRAKGYGPCIPYDPNCNCTAEQLRQQIRRNRQFRVIMNTTEWASENWFGGVVDGLLIGAHWYSDRQNHGNIPGNWEERTWSNFLGLNIHRIGDWEATEIRLENIEHGRRALEHMDRGWLKVRCGRNILGTISTATAQALTEECGIYVKNNLREVIRDYENGKSINKNINFH